jgi:hypothetical protein
MIICTLEVQDNFGVGVCFWKKDASLTIIGLILHISSSKH